MPKYILYLGLNPEHYAANGEITHWPIIQIVSRPLTDPFLREALHHFAHYTHVIVTSKSTVTILKDHLLHLNIDLQQWKVKATLAVGQVTAKHLKSVGIVPLKIAQNETAEGILEELKQLPLEKANIFWPHSSQARQVIKDFLVEQNIQHTTCVLYDPKPRPPSQLPSLDHFDEVIFTSPSTVQAFFTFFEQLPSSLSLVAVGPITARFLKSILEERKNEIWSSHFNSFNMRF